MIYGPHNFYDDTMSYKLERRGLIERKKDGPPQVSDIIQVVSEVSKVSVRDIIGPWRWQGYMIPRLSVYWIARNFTLQSYPQIARSVGRRDHTTIMSGVRRVEKYTRIYRPIIEPALEILENRGFYMMAEVKFE